MTKELIEITFGNAMTQARELESCADSMLRLSKDKLASIQNELAMAWQGENANLYFSKMEQAEGNILKTADKLRDIAETLRQVARIFRDSETRALEIATQRTYNA